MAMTSVLTLSQPAQMGTPANFMVAITNGGVSTVTIQSIKPVVKRADGSIGVACNIGVVRPNPTADVGAAATLYFPFSISFFGPAISGGPTQPSQTFMVDCVMTYSDGTASGCLSPLLVNLNQPQFGQAPGAPPNPVPVIGQLDFQSPFASALAL